MRRLLFCLSILLIPGCDTPLTPTGLPPANIVVDPLNPTAPPKPDVSTWSPYLGIHATGGAYRAYEETARMLIKAGKLKGVRVGIVKAEGFNNHIIALLNSLGLELLGIVDNLYLFDPDIERRMDEIIAAYPYIKVLQIGNETTSILPKSGPTMTIEQYMPVLRRIYNHVTKNYPGITLVTQCPLGHGYSGSREIERMGELGLNEMSPQKLIIAINVYSPSAMSGYTGAVTHPVIRRFRIWVTETGSIYPDRHISYVQQYYPLFRNGFRAERIYWYVHWAGDDGGDTGASLIRLINGPNELPGWYSPLFKALAGME